MCACGRGIDVVRNKIKMFAHSKVTLPPGRHKIVILDEADRCSSPYPENTLLLVSGPALYPRQSLLRERPAGRQRDGHLYIASEFRHLA